MSAICQPSVIEHTCGQKRLIEKLVDKVLDGNEHKPSLLSRMDAQETLTGELSRIVKGDKEGEGLLFHMTEIRAGMRFLKWELAVVLSALMVIAGFMALRH